MTEKAMYIIVPLLLGFNGFFLIRFWFLVDEIRKDVKDFLIHDTLKTGKIENIETTVTDIKKTVHSHDKKLSQLEIELIKLKTE